MHLFYCSDELHTFELLWVTLLFCCWEESCSSQARHAPIIWRIGWEGHWEFMAIFLGCWVSQAEFPKPLNHPLQLQPNAYEKRPELHDLRYCTLHNAEIPRREPFQWASYPALASHNYMASELPGSSIHIRIRTLPYPQINQVFHLPNLKSPVW